MYKKNLLLSILIPGSCFYLCLGLCSFGQLYALPLNNPAVEKSIQEENFSELDLTVVRNNAEIMTGDGWVLLNEYDFQKSDYLIFEGKINEDNLSLIVSFCQQVKLNLLVRFDNFQNLQYRTIPILETFFDTHVDGHDFKIVNQAASSQLFLCL